MKRETITLVNALFIVILFVVIIMGFFVLYIRKKYYFTNDVQLV
jgi:hypothetical protein